MRRPGVCRWTSLPFDVVHDHAGDRAVLPRVVDLLVAQPQVRAVLGRGRRRADQQDGEHE
jgi:hypothetical protein